jgi:hypothetical protein
VEGHVTFESGLIQGTGGRMITSGDGSEAATRAYWVRRQSITWRDDPPVCRCRAGDVVVESGPIHGTAGRMITSRDGSDGRRAPCQPPTGERQPAGMGSTAISRRVFASPGE